MLFKDWQLSGIADGRIDRAYRRWAEPRVAVGSRMRTHVGVLEVNAVRRVESITAIDAARAGYASVERLEADLGDRPGDLYEVTLHLAGPDPREELRESLPDTAELDVIVARLERLDRASSRGPWTAAVLRTIAERPGVRAPDLAASFGRETIPFKVDVRKLKELGLTESLPVGYRLSPRGVVVLAHLDAHPRIVEVPSR